MQICRIGILMTIDPTLHYKMMEHLLCRAGAGCVQQKDTLTQLLKVVVTGCKTE